jgi:hypothetical protein|tara:strand:+ start:458 stop:784 length:327 start_codon:yes stop_codon:yes gene_type:complete
MQYNSGVYGKKPIIDIVEETTIRNLSETAEFMEALNTKTGQVLFKDLMLLLDEKFKLIYNENSNEQDRAIFSACKHIAKRWNSLIEKHSKNVGMLERVRGAKNKKKLE